MAGVDHTSIKTFIQSEKAITGFSHCGCGAVWAGMRWEGGEGLRSRSSVVNWSLHVSINLFLHSFVKGYWEGRGIGLSVTVMFKVCVPRTRY